MHATSLPPAGKGILLESKPDGEWVRSKVVEPTAMRLVDENVYTGYSVGIARPRIDRDMRARNGRIVGGKIVELSLVDRPANPAAKFVALKMAGSGKLEWFGEEVLQKVTVVDDTEAPAPKRPAPARVKRFRSGMHVTVHARNEYGQVEAYEGRVVTKSYGSLALDRGGYDWNGGVKRFSFDDITAVYKGSVPLLTKGEPEGGPQHHSTEVSVAVDQKPADDDKPGAAADDDSAANGDADDDGDADKVAAGKCMKCKGTGKVDGADCAACEGSGNAPTVTKSKGKKVSKGVDHPSPDGSASMLDSDSDPTPSLADSVPTDKKPKQFPGKPKRRGIRPAMKVEQAEGGGFAIIEKGKTLATHPTLEAAEAQKQAILDERALQKSAEWLLRRAHDFTCGAYKTADVAEAYPGKVSEILGPSTRKALTRTLARTVRKDGGSGKQAAKIRYLSGALAALNDIIAVEKRKDSKKVVKVINAAREDLHTAFKIGNMGLEEAHSDLPKPSQSVTPGQFKRGYLSSGHQRESSPGNAAPNIPTTTHPIDADDYTRGPLTDGHQRYLASKLADLHDGLSYWKPEMCRMDAGGSNAFDRQPFGAFQRPPATAEMDNRQDVTAHPVSPGQTHKAPGEKAQKAPKRAEAPAPEAFKFNGAAGPSVTELTEEQLQAVLSKTFPGLMAKITTLESTVEELSRQPDPARSANRGVTGVQMVEKVSRANEVQQSAGRRKKAERIDFLKSLARSGDSDQRIRATERLSRMGIDLVD